MPGGNEVERLRKTERIFLALAAEVVAPKTTIGANTEPTKASSASRIRCATDMNVSIRRAGDSKRPYGSRKVFVSETGYSWHESGALDSGALPIAAK